MQSLIQLPPYRDDQYKDENGNGRWDNWEKISKDWDGDGEFDFAPRVKLTIARSIFAEPADQLGRGDEVDRKTVV